MKMKLTIYEGDAVPFGYGLAWREWSVMGTVVIIMPFNWIMRWLRNIYFFLTRQGHKNTLEAFSKGVEQGNTMLQYQKELIFEKGINFLQEAMDIRLDCKGDDELSYKRIHARKEEIIKKL